MMRIYTLLFLLATGFEGLSKCHSKGLVFWPEKKTVSPNSVFVIEGYAQSQKIIKGLGTVYQVYLQSATEKIKLELQELLVGQDRLTQAILKPGRTLTVGKEYELIIENLAQPEKEIFRLNDSTRQKEKVKWLVSGFIDTIPPAWMSLPEFSNSSYQMWGCGPEAFAYFSFSAMERSEYLIKTTVKNQTTGHETTYYLKPDGQKIAVGHGMCSGAFSFYGGDKFEVEFALYDASGNLTKWHGRRLEFNAPA
jgi:hypothetical protein